MNTITLEGKKYNIIQEIKGDGRCFSASIYYYLHKQNPDDDILNGWIFESIIKPILDTENTNCPKFFGWAALWGIIHNNDLRNREEYFSRITEEVNIDPKIELVHTLFTKLAQQHLTMNYLHHIVSFLNKYMIKYKK